ncbi:class I tRNA ligase family protein [Campylobacter coli]|uniref:class I tRNA ligase family protein n=1 Tax=Campylobacter coli TaxID=195 RepID=UPI00382CF034
MLGVMADLAKPDMTLEVELEAAGWRKLFEVAKKGLLFERSRPVCWSWACKSAFD